MRSLVQNQCRWPVQLGHGGARSAPAGGGGRSISFGGGRSSSFAPIKVTSSTSSYVCNGTLSISASTKQYTDLLPIPPLRSLSSSPPPPWLLVSSSYFNHIEQNQELLDHYPYCFVSVSENKIFRLDKTQVPSQMRHPWDDEFFFPEDTEFCGTSSQGWVFIMHPRTQQMYLINPLFPSDSIVPLPPVHDFDRTVVVGSVSKSPTWSYNDNPNLFIQYISWRKSCGYISPEDHYADEKIQFNPEFAMSSAPSDPNCIVLVQNYGVLGFWKPRHKSWTRLKVPNATYFGHSIVYSNAHQCFYLLDTARCAGKVNVDTWKWEPDSPQPQRTGHFEVPSPVTECKRYADCRNYVERKWQLRGEYLVESTSGDLLLVEMYSIDEEDKEDEYEDPPSLQFFVFKLNFGQCKWEHVKSLGEGSALFMGNNYGFCVHVGNYPELKPNCIYYSADDQETILLPKAAALPIVVVFDMEDGTVHPYRYMSDSHRNFDLAPRQHPSIWLFPNLS